METMSERLREGLRHLARTGGPMPGISYTDYLHETVRVGEREIPFGEMTSDDLREWAAEDRARAYTDYLQPSES